MIEQFDHKLGSFKDERGIALLISLLVMAIMTVVVLELSYEVQVDAALAGNSFQALEAEYAARSGVSFCMAMLREDAENDLALPPGARTDDLTEPWVAGFEPQQVGRAMVAARISDEDGKFNINRVVNENKPTEADPRSVGQLKHLFVELGVIGDADPAELTDPVCDWVDPDSVRRHGGAERVYYEQLPISYACKNKWLDSIEELALVKGFTLEMISGRRVTSVDEFEPGLAEFLTVFGGVEGRININTAPEPVIRAVFHRSPAVAESIISQRATAPFEGLKDLQQRVPQKFGTGINVSFASEHFSILSEADLKGTRVKIETMVRRRITNEGVMFETVAWKVTS
jgi:general secretion pathway protein K